MNTPARTQLKSGHDYLLSAEEAIPHDIPTKGMIHMQAEVTVDCNKNFAFDFISSGAELPNWLRKVGMIPSAVKAENITPTYNKPGDKRIIHFEGDESVHEELITFNPYDSYSYKVSKFSSVLRKYSDKSYSVIWFDPINDKTRITWEYMYTAKNSFARIILKLILGLITYEKFMKISLANAKAYIENMD